MNGYSVYRSKKHRMQCFSLADKRVERLSSIFKNGYIQLFAATRKKKTKLRKNPTRCRRRPDKFKSGMVDLPLPGLPFVI
ncbi:MAG: hypothetical protein AB8G15_02230 [Saprospiraceae bacterium]